MPSTAASTAASEAGVRSTLAVPTMVSPKKANLTIRPIMEVPPITLGIDSTSTMNGSREFPSNTTQLAGAVRLAPTDELMLGLWAVLILV